MPNKGKNAWYVGLDLHRRTSTFCVKTQDGRLITKEKMVTEPTVMSEYIQSLQKQCGGQLRVVHEPISQWYFYTDLLETLGCEVHLAHPMRVKAIAHARVKTDAIDAEVLCDLLRANLLPEAYRSPKEVRSWKEMVRARASFIHLRVQVKNRIHAILHKHALVHEFSNLFGKGGMKWLQSLELDEPFQSNLNEYIETFDQLTTHIDTLEQKIVHMVENNEAAHLLTSIPGISYVSALTIMAEIGDIHRFTTAKQLMGYAGVVPSTYSSGDTVRHGKITKTGSKWLRTIMIEASHHQFRMKSSPFYDYAQKIKKRKGGKTAAVATARKLLAVVWRLLSDERPFEWHYTPHTGKPQMRAY